MSEPWKDDPDGWKASVRGAQVASGPRAFRWAAGLVEWLYVELPPAARKFRGVIGIAIALQLAELALHAYEVFR